MIKTDPTKFYTVSVTRYIDDEDPEFETLSGIHLTIDSAAKKVAGIVNDTLAFEGKKRRVNIKSCYDGYVLSTGDGKLVVSITAHDRPWIVTHMNCDDRTVDYTLHHTQAEAEREVTVEAKQDIAEVGKGSIEYVYADRDGDCEIELDSIKKSERYLLIDTLGGNRIDITSQQL